MVRLILGKGKRGQSHGEHPAVQTPKCETWGREEGNRIIHRVFTFRVFNDHTRVKLLLPHGEKAKRIMARSRKYISTMKKKINLKTISEAAPRGARKPRENPF